MKKLITSVASLILFFGNLYSQTLKKDTIYFDFDRYELRKESEQKLSELSNFLLMVEDYKITISGHTDSLGKENYNLNLSEKRAEATRNYLIKNGLNETKLTWQSFGESKPIRLNSKERLRQHNRRVEIICAIEPKVVIKNIISDSMNKKPVTKKFENDTIIRGEKGTELVLKEKTFYPYKINEIRFEIREVFSRGDMISEDLPTVDNNGNCLVSAGMVFLSATLNGKPVQPNKDSTFLIRIPADNIDTAMKIYNVNSNGGATSWVQTNMKLTYDKTGAKFYEFKTDILSSYNLDCVPLLYQAVNLVAKLKAKFKEKGLVVKSRKMKYGKAYLTSDEIVMVSKGRLIKPKKVNFSPCSVRNNTVFVAVFDKKGQSYLVNKPLNQLKYKRFRNRYVIRKKDYVRMSNEQIKEVLASI